MSSRHLMAGEWIDPQTGQFRSAVRDGLDRPVCASCRTLVFNDQIWCDSCFELHQTTVNQFIETVMQVRSEKDND